jgi:hypothetical protein
MKYLFGILIILGVASAHAAEKNFSSGPQQKVLVELYTSEGCNSCPPAEEYLNGLDRNKALWSDFVPVAFHVDYWDELGWPDRYAQADFGKRQSRYAALKKQRTVYTPAFVLNGEMWRPATGLIKRDIPASGKTSGELQLNLKDKQVSARYQDKNQPLNDLVLNIAILGMDITSHIEAGENKGRTAQHDFVVIGFKALPANNGEWQTTLPDLHYQGANRTALAAWISRADDPTPLQTVGGEL